LELISPSGLGGAFDIYRKCIEALEENYVYKINCLGEPQLGRRGLYPTISKKGWHGEVKVMMDFIAYADGTNDLIAISNIVGVPVEELAGIAEKIKNAGLIESSIR
jgi:aminopeptidase-like protein